MLFLATAAEDDDGESELCPIFMEDELWSSLPQHLLFAILARLPLPSFVRFRAVCKLWNTLLRNPSSSFFSSPPRSYRKPCAVFITRHVHLDFCVAPQPPLRKRKFLKFIRPHVEEEEEKGGRLKLRWHRLEPDFLAPSDYLMSSHAGLVLLRRTHTCYVVCNPLLRVSREISPPSIGNAFPLLSVFHGSLTLTAIFGMNPASTSFKMIWAQGFPPLPYPGELLPSFLYDSAIGEWRSIAGRPVVNTVLFKNYGTLCKKICYWSMKDLDLLAFDFEWETWHILKTKRVPESKPPKYYTLWEWQDHLMMIALDNGRIALWQLSEDNRWDELEPLTPGTHTAITNGFLPFHCTCMGNILVFVNSAKNKVLAYNFVSKALIISDVSHDSSLFCESLLPFQPSLEAHWS